MAFMLQHILVSQRLFPDTHETPQGIFFTVAAQGSFQLLYPGALQKTVQATVRHSMRIDTPDTTVPDPPGGIDTPGHHPPHPPGGPPQPPHSGVTVNEEGFVTLDLQIFDPDGKPFTRNEITLADLRKYRDLRGSSRGQWRFTLRGQSRVYNPNPALNESVTDPKGVINLTVLEAVASASAAPLVPKTRLDGSAQRMTFDLNRVGRFVATIFPNNIANLWRGTMRLLDPDGVVVASGTRNQLHCPIPLSALGKSRDANGKPRLWTLEALPLGALHGNQSISATVVGEGRIGTAILRDRIQALIGPNGSFIQLKGENKDGFARAVLTITDVVAAETVDMHGLLDSRLKEEKQSLDIQVNEPMVLYSRSDDLDYGLSLDVSGIRLRSINIEIGPGGGLGAAIPALSLVIRVDGEVRVKWGPKVLATARLRGGKLAMEVGIKIDPDGTPRIVQSVPDEPFDIDMDNVVVAALVLALGVVGGVSAIAIAEYVEEVVNERFSKGAADLFDDPALAPTILMTVFGAHLTRLPVRFEGNDILFEHIAPLEPDPQPRKDYAGAIGRTVMHEAIGHATFVPHTLGNTWAADNLKAKIEHIVVVMMENRSYDHVLGYRAQARINDGADGWTSDLMTAVNAAALPPPAPSSDPLHPPPGSGTLSDGSEVVPPVRPLRKSAFALNARKLRTRIPKGVGHELSDVTQQLSGRIDGPGGRRINDPKGFIDNFRDKKLGGNAAGADGVVPFDVLGYYEKDDTQTDANTHDLVNDLPVYGFLAENYAYCDRYFCSHPGPTLPNRMFSLCGDVQYDRLSVPILDNNHGDNFLLSRSMTVYDLLTRAGVSWRVYESNPSVTMLRMFARYATDDINIRPLAEFASAVAAGNLPSLTVVEPAMHHYPEDDDHPDADMFRGQSFIRKVYKALRANPDTWRKTLLLITYDEHGGLYDHVIPPIADVLNAGRPDVVIGGDATTGPTGGGGLHPGTGGVHPGGGTSGGVSGGGHGGINVHDVHISPDVLDVLIGEPAQPAAPPTDATIDIPYGVRVPTFVVSPWVKAGKGPSVVLDHCSILKTILARFCGDMKPFLSDRVHASRSFESFLTEAQPRLNVGGLPDFDDLPADGTPRLVSGASRTVTAPVFRKRMREEQIDFHEVSGRLARMLGR